MLDKVRSEESGGGEDTYVEVGFNIFLKKIILKLIQKRMEEGC